MVEEVEDLVGILIHRGEMIAMAEGYVKRLGFYDSFGSAGSFESLEWRHDPTNVALRPYYSIAWNELRARAVDKLPKQPTALGPQYHKPLSYVAAACAASKSDRERVQKEFDRIVQRMFCLLPICAAMQMVPTH